MPILVKKLNATLSDVLSQNEFLHHQILTNIEQYSVDETCCGYSKEAKSMSEEQSTNEYKIKLYHIVDIINIMIYLVGVFVPLLIYMIGLIVKAYTGISIYGV